jgi:hypothetical protein
VSGDAAEDTPIPPAEATCLAGPGRYGGERAGGDKLVVFAYGASKGAATPFAPSEANDTRSPAPTCTEDHPGGRSERR